MLPQEKVAQPWHGEQVEVGARSEARGRNVAGQLFEAAIYTHTFPKHSIVSIIDLAKKVTHFTNLWYASMP
jgi:hypothetical protein